MARPRYHSRRPLIEFVLSEVDRLGIPVQEVEKRAGLARGTVGNWGCDRNEPKVGNLQAIGNVLGYELCWKPKYETKQRSTERHERADFLLSSCSDRLSKARAHLQALDRILSASGVALTVVNGATPCTPSIPNKSKPMLHGKLQSTLGSVLTRSGHLSG